MKAGQFIAFMGDSGDAEGTQPHLHFEMHMPNGTVIDPYTSLRLAQGLPASGLCSVPTNPAPHPSPAGGTGYWTLGANGAVLGFGSAQRYPRPGPGREVDCGRARSDRRRQGLLGHRCAGHDHDVRRRAFVRLARVDAR